MHYVAFVHKDEDSCYGVSFPDIPGCTSAGDTLEEALANAREALAFHLEGEIADERELPKPRTVDEIKADPTLSDWREGAMLVLVPLVMDRGTARRVNVSFDPGLLEAIDDAAKARGMSRSAFLASAARKEIERTW